MCRSTADGGRRCGRAAHWRQVSSSEELKSQIQADRLPIDWDIPPGSQMTPAQMLDEYGEAAGVAALQRSEVLREVEAEMTTDVLASVPPAVDMAELQCRLKSPHSIARKVADKAEGTGATPEETIGDITDAVRYTAVCQSGDELVASASTTLTELKMRGWQIREVENQYVEGNPYKGLHVLAAKGTEVAEIQFHTKLTMQIKEKTHLDYDIVRDRGAAWADKVAADRRNREAWAQVSAPEGLSGLRSLAGCSMTMGKVRRRLDGQPQEEGAS